ncbi:hypothetical protein TNCV_4071821 [Trichonephila clavipes]|uniref:Uncharacterized protein n=1 Tax=Trichonephila clavipes TaxID=2585209 RepID=A0A8X7BGP5_TRICX|nr:hypothetical protein TNCV_4071821 [Trichonephila clavipes]
MTFPVHALLSIALTPRALSALLTNVFVFLMSTVPRKYSAAEASGGLVFINSNMGWNPLHDALLFQPKHFGQKIVPSTESPF